MFLGGAVAAIVSGGTLGIIAGGVSATLGMGVAGLANLKAQVKPIHVRLEGRELVIDEKLTCSAL